MKAAAAGGQCSRSHRSYSAPARDSRFPWASLRAGSPLRRRWRSGSGRNDRPLGLLSLLAQSCAAKYSPSAKPGATSCIDSHPCKERKDGAPSVGTAHAETTEGRAPGLEAMSTVISVWTKSNLLPKLCRVYHTASQHLHAVMGETLSGVVSPPMSSSVARARMQALRLPRFWGSDTCWIPASSGFEDHDTASPTTPYLPDRTPLFD
jgi:hypothetical protein